MSKFSRKDKIKHQKKKLETLQYKKTEKQLCDNHMDSSYGRLRLKKSTDDMAKKKFLIIK